MATCGECERVVDRCALALYASGRCAGLRGGEGATLEDRERADADVDRLGCEMKMLNERGKNGVAVGPREPLLRVLAGGCLERETALERCNGVIAEQPLSLADRGRTADLSGGKSEAAADRKDDGREPGRAEHPPRPATQTRSYESLSQATIRRYAIRGRITDATWARGNAFQDAVRCLAVLFFP